MWQRAFYRIFDGFVAFHAHEYEPATPANSPCNEHGEYDITLDPSLLIWLLAIELQNCLTGHTQLTFEEACVLLQMDHPAFMRDIFDGYLPGSECGVLDAAAFVMMLTNWTCTVCE